MVFNAVWHVVCCDVAHRQATVEYKLQRSTAAQHITLYRPFMNIILLTSQHVVVNFWINYTTC